MHGQFFPRSCCVSPRPAIPSPHSFHPSRIHREYYLSYLWYGGTFRQGDYYSCAKIRISGGPIQNTWKPIYVNNKNGQCYSTASTLGQCRQEPCYRPPHWIRPDAWNGRTPGQLNRWEVTK